MKKITNKQKERATEIAFMFKMYCRDIERAVSKYPDIYYDCQNKYKKNKKEFIDNKIINAIEMLSVYSRDIIDLRDSLGAKK